MGKIVRRFLDIKLPPGKSAFLWGPRKVGKTFWVREILGAETVVDLLKTDLFAEFAARPALLRERYESHKGLIVIDEVQKVPALLDEVHWLIENRGLSFLLTGSSARKLRRGHANLLGGRAWRRTMLPLSALEVSGFELEASMMTGMLPPHFLSPAPLEDLRAYVADYLKEEIAAEALVRDIPAFSEFLRVAALTSSELLNYTNVARETGVSPKVVRTYFDIIEETHLGSRVPPWRKSRSRRMILAEKFYLFDVGVANFLAKRQPRLGSSEFGKSFEHFILMELKAFQSYREPDMPISFWRSAGGVEMDFLLGDKDVALEVKGSPRVHDVDLRPFSVLLEDGPVRRKLVVSLERQPRKAGGVEILPWQVFLERLWGGDLL